MYFAAALFENNIGEDLEVKFKLNHMFKVNSPLIGIEGTVTKSFNPSNSRALPNEKGGAPPPLLICIQLPPNAAPLPTIPVPPLIPIGYFLF